MCLAKCSMCKNSKKIQQILMQMCFLCRHVVYIFFSLPRSQKNVNQNTYVVVIIRIIVIRNSYSVIIGVIQMIARPRPIVAFQCLGVNEQGADPAAHGEASEQSP